MADGFIPENGTLKMAKFKAATNEGVATILVKVPGTFSPDKPGRVLAGGSARWEGTSHPDDWVEVSVVDHDNMLQQGVDHEIASYVDKEVEAANQGWYMLNGSLEVEALAGYGRVPGQMWLKIVFHTGDNRADTVRGNINWGTEG